MKKKSTQLFLKDLSPGLIKLKQEVKLFTLIGIPVKNGFDFIPVSDIIMCQAYNNCTYFHLTTPIGKLKVSKTLKWVEHYLCESSFFRVHDSFIVNLAHIKKYRRGGEGGVLQLTQDWEIDVSRRKKESFLQALYELKIIFDYPV